MAFMSRESPPDSELPAKGRAYGGVSQAERQSERRARFIEAGIAAFGRDGFAATTTRSLCAEAGLTQRYFYESFEGLEALFVAVVRHLGERLDEKLLTAAARAPQEPQEQLRALSTAFFSLLKKDVHAARILLIEVYTAGTVTGALAM